jgi:hypothetical protein
MTYRLMQTGRDRVQLQQKVGEAWRTIPAPWEKP